MNARTNWVGVGALLGATLFCCPAIGQYDGLVINEILPSPTNASGAYVDANQDGAASSIDDEFVELLNTSAASIDVAGMWLTDANVGIRRHVFSPRTLPPGGSIVVFGGGSLLNFSNPPAQLATGSGLSLNNDVETVNLFSPQTALVAQVSYQLTASHNAISLVRNPEGTGGFTNHLLVTTNAARASPGRRAQGLPFLVDQPPVLMDLPNQTAFVGLELQFPVRAFDPADRDAITLSLLDNPAGSSLTATGGVGSFSFTPAPDQAGQTYAVAFVAGDDDGAATNLVSIQVINPNAAEDVWINEIHYDNVGTDSDEGIEIAGTASSVLADYALVLYNGNDGRAYNTNVLTGTLDDERCGYGAAWFGYPVNGIQNGPGDGVALVKNSAVIQFLSYDGVLTASNGPAAGQTSVDLGVKEANASTPAGYSLQLKGTGTVYASFAWTAVSPHSRGTLNAGQTIECLAPAAIEIQKTVYLGHDGGASAPGAESVQGTNGAAVTYVFRVANVGGRALTNAAIQDVSLGIPPIVLGTLATGSVQTAYVENAISGDLRNVATATGYDPDGNPVADDDTAEVVEIISDVDLQLSVYRGHDGGAACPGAAFLQATNETPVTFCFLVENNGNTNVNALVISNATLGIAPIAIGTLPAGGTFATSVATVATGSLTHVATLSGTDPNGDPLGDQASATVEIIHPAIQLQKTVYLGHDGGAACPGSEAVAGTNGAPITYCFQIANPGDVALTNVVLHDADLSGFTVTNLGPLATGETWTAHFETVLDGDLHNVAAASGYGPDGGRIAAEDAADVAEFVAGLDLRKTVYRGHDGGAACPGGDFLQATNGTPVTYCFEVENVGTTNLSSVVIGDPALGLAPILVGPLASGAVFATSVAAVVAGNLTNVATAAGTDPNGAPVGDQDSAVVETIRPSLQLQKSVYLGHDGGASCPGAESIAGTNGAPITYCFRISNDGDSALTNVALSDADLPGFPNTSLGTLAAGESTSLYFESLLLQAHVNSATAAAFSVLGDRVQAVDTATVALQPPTNVLGDAEYVVVDLGTLGGNASEALGLNDRGEAVGWAKDGLGRTQAFRWQNGTLTGLGFLPGGSLSVATAINNLGEATGHAGVSPTNNHAFLYVSNGLVDLGTLGGPNSWGRGINAQGDVVGSSMLVTNSPNNTDPETFLWRSNRFIHIPPYGGNNYSCDGYGINAAGWICGITFLYSPSAHWWAYVWYDANGDFTNDWDDMRLLGSLAPKDSGGEYSQALDVNDLGQAVGWTGITNTFYPQHAFLVTASNGQWKIPDSNVNPTNLLMRDLGALNGPANTSAANALNNQTWIVGTSTTGTGTNHAFLWRQGAMQDLNGLIASNSGWVLTNATGINEHNEIVGSGLHQGQTRAYMLRQEGRITRLETILQTNVWVYTNELAEVVTQTTVQVAGQVLQWAGIWGGVAARAFTVESCDALSPPQWEPVAPTTQWPIAESYWTNSDYGTVSTRFFRVRAR